MHGSHAGQDYVAVFVLPDQLGTLAAVVYYNLYFSHVLLFSMVIIPRFHG
jgi:hypothetical protein